MSGYYGRYNEHKPQIHIKQETHRNQITGSSNNYENNYGNQVNKEEKQNNKNGINAKNRSFKYQDELKQQNTHKFEYKQLQPKTKLIRQQPNSYSKQSVYQSKQPNSHSKSQRFYQIDFNQISLKSEKLNQSNKKQSHLNQSNQKQSHLRQSNQKQSYLRYSNNKQSHLKQDHPQQSHQKQLYQGNLNQPHSPHVKFQLNNQNHDQSRINRQQSPNRNIPHRISNYYQIQNYRKNSSINSNNKIKSNITNNINIDNNNINNNSNISNNSNNRNKNIQSRQQQFLKRKQMFMNKNKNYQYDQYQKKKQRQEEPTQIKGYKKNLIQDFQGTNQYRHMIKQSNLRNQKKAQYQQQIAKNQLQNQTIYKSLKQKDPSQSKFIQSIQQSVVKSKLHYAQQSQTYKYIKYDQQGNTQLVSLLPEQNLQANYSYKKVKLSNEIQSSGKFAPSFKQPSSSRNQKQVLGSNIIWEQDILRANFSKGIKKIVMRPLRRLYERHFRPQFFEFVQQTKKISYQEYNKQIPDCLYQIDHLSKSHIKSLFITQSYQDANGIYEVVINVNGYYQIVQVNDLVPVYQQSNEHIWDILQPWQMILIKVWASLKGGYINVMSEYKPIQFLQCFSSNNWKYYNLQRQKQTFLKAFKNKMRISYIVLQTKQSNEVLKMGLIPSSAGYNIFDISDTIVKNGHNRKSISNQTVLVKSRFKHKWSGQLNVVNSKHNINLQGSDNLFKLEKNFLMTKEQFFNIFGCAYITSLSKSNTHISDFHQIIIPKGTKKAVYLKFIVKKQCFMDFSFIQHRNNIKAIKSNQSKIEQQKYLKQIGLNQSKVRIKKSRYLRCKYMLIKCLKKQKKSFQSKISEYSKIKQPSLTSAALYQAYETCYLRGYNKGESHYMIMEPGLYYFRLKSEPSQQIDSRYFLNYCSEEKFEIVEEIISEEEKQEIMENCVLSLLPVCKKYTSSVAVIYSGNVFETFGYGFLLIQAFQKEEGSKRNLNCLLIQIDQKKLFDEGFEIKGKKYKNKDNPIAIKVTSQKYAVLIFKKVQGKIKQQYSWPPKSIDIFKSFAFQLQSNRFQLFLF